MCLEEGALEEVLDGAVDKVEGPEEEQVLGEVLDWIMFSHKVGKGDHAQLVERSYACFSLAVGAFSYQTTYRHPPYTSVLRLRSYSDRLNT